MSSVTPEVIHTANITVNHAVVANFRFNLHPFKRGSEVGTSHLVHHLLPPLLSSSASSSAPSFASLVGESKTRVTNGRMFALRNDNRRRNTAELQTISTERKRQEVAAAETQLMCLMSNLFSNVFYCFCMHSSGLYVFQLFVQQFCCTCTVTIKAILFYSDKTGNG